MVRPSRNNMHEFVAEENTCFFDICLPNYTADSLRRITYFKDITELHNEQAEQISGENGLPMKEFADSTLDISCKVGNLKHIMFDSTPPKLPVNFEVADIAYRGELKI